MRSAPLRIVLSLTIGAFVAACTTGNPAISSTGTGGAVVAPTSASATAGPGPGSPGSASSAGSGAWAPAALAPVPRVVVARGTARSVGSLQALADDLADGDTAAIVRKCWTVAPQRLAWGLFDHRAVVLAALTSADVGTERGRRWGTDRDSVFVTWAELDSSYACPEVVIDGRELPLQPADATLIFQRLDAQLRGQPVRPSDSLAVYPLLCDTHGLGATPGAAADARPAGQQIDPRFWPLVARMATEPLTVSGSGAQFSVTSRSGVTASLVKNGGHCLRGLVG